MLGDGKLLDGLMADGLTCAINGIAMGLCAEKTCHQMSISRKESDEYCLRSYNLAQKAWKEGFYKDQVVDIEVKSKKKLIVVNEDEDYKKVIPEKVFGLRPVFDPKGTITAANASSINDAGAASIIMSKDKAQAMGIKPLARILCFADGETLPELFPQAPALAV